MSPFNRHIQPDEMWLYRNPRRDPYVTNATLWGIVLLTPLTLALLHLIIKRDKEDFVQVLYYIILLYYIIFLFKGCISLYMIICFFRLGLL